MPEMYIKMLGGYEVVYNGKQLEFGKNKAGKAGYMFAILAFFGEKGINRKELIEALFSEDKAIDSGNNLRVTTHKLRKMFTTGSFPEYDYIRVAKDVYTFTAPFEVKIDALEFMKLTEGVELDTLTDEKINCINEAMNLYTGEFMPDISCEDWVIAESVKCQERFFDVSEILCDYYFRQNNYDEVIRICDKVLAIYPEERFFIRKMKSLAESNMITELFNTYEEAASAIFDKNGVGPSEEMNSFIREYNEVDLGEKNLSKIMMGLAEKELKSGALYCTYPSFVDNYRMVKRIITRTGQSVYLILASLVNEDGTLMQNEKKLGTLSSQLKDSIQKSLRIGDVVTRISKNQFLIMVLDVQKESCKIISKRIEMNFAETHKHWRNYVKFEEASVKMLDSAPAR